MDPALALPKHGSRLQRQDKSIQGFASCSSWGQPRNTAVTTKDNTTQQLQALLRQKKGNTNLGRKQAVIRFLQHPLPRLKLTVVETASLLLLPRELPRQATGCQGLLRALSGLLELAEAVAVEAGVVQAGVPELEPRGPWEAVLDAEQVL